MAKNSQKESAMKQFFNYSQRVKYSSIFIISRNSENMIILTVFLPFALKIPKITLKCLYSPLKSQIESRSCPDQIIGVCISHRANIGPKT